LSDDSDAMSMPKDDEGENGEFENLDADDDFSKRKVGDKLEG